jgi:hypothetical protein
VTYSKFAILLSLGALIGACAAPTTSEADAPEAALDSVSEQDEGASYNGWTQVGGGSYGLDSGSWGFSHVLQRSYGDNTRGGGACIVVQKGNTCSSDGDCMGLAQAEFGPAAYGYCYAGYCKSRPGGQAGNCTLNPNRGAGQLDLWGWGYYSSNPAILGCMTKTGGPNTACGGTNTSLYMRSVWGFNFY